jgi:hypothetical protein
MDTTKITELPIYVPNEIAEDPIFKYFAYEHLPPNLRSVSEKFYQLAYIIVTTLPRSAERTVALRKLLESKDAAVRAALP